MRRLHHRIRAKANLVYSLEDICSLYGVNKNTPTNWQKAGGRPIDEKLPKLFKGSELNRFHDLRFQLSKRPCGLLELFCVGCGFSVIPVRSMLQFEPVGRFRSKVHGQCPKCDSRISQLVRTEKFELLKRYADPNANLSVDDYMVVKPQVVVGKDLAPVNSPEFSRHPRFSFPAAVRTRRATASRSSHACASGCRTSRYIRTRPAWLRLWSCRSGAVSAPA